ncbi:hypothetical protein SAMN04488693_10156 [Arthrobacter subterraneus]|uniref:Uncharacterized protein n=1 Tax=Arthrobacter subterraneus TaxID=335973 RepID=A0A1G8BUF3_9MICC|nr:hypothetical protein [Arthrobacter subterraneus]SDH36748.1 hypothetical protein SAMN04488693_10156 [Arthrobacter subterraneus]
MGEHTVAAWRVRLLLTCALLGSLAVLVTGCRIEVPVPPGAGGQDPTVTVPAAPLPSSPVADPAGPGLPPLPRSEIVGNDMTFDRGGYIEPAEKVAFSETLSRAPGWTPAGLLVQGESVYVSDAGCTVSLSHTPRQGPLLVSGDDRASTEALFRYLDPSILPEYLEGSTWLWGESPGNATASVEFLAYRQEAAAETPASVVSLRLFHTTGTALAFIVSCPRDELLTAALSDLRNHVSVVPPR